jgi:CRISPR/Cas system-associated exonuclease Cas4 (RecB family)
MAETDRWVSASDLEEYAYCPRAHWYRHHPPPGGPRPESVARSRAGQRYHERELGAERRREEHGAGYLAAVLVGLFVAVGGAAWIFLR